MSIRPLQKKILSYVGQSFAMNSRGCHWIACTTKMRIKELATLLTGMRKSPFWIYGYKWLGRCFWFHLFGCALCLLVRLIDWRFTYPMCINLVWNVSAMSIHHYAWWQFPTAKGLKLHLPLIKRQGQGKQIYVLFTCFTHISPLSTQLLLLLHMAFISMFYDARR